MKTKDLATACHTVEALEEMSKMKPDNCSALPKELKRAKRELRKRLLAFGLTAMMVFLQGCNTVNGIGRDLQDWSRSNTERSQSYSQWENSQRVR